MCNVFTAFCVNFSCIRTEIFISEVEIAKMFRSLANEKISILAISTSEIKISVLIREELTQKAVKTLHKTFGLN